MKKSIGSLFLTFFLTHTVAFISFFSCDSDDHYPADGAEDADLAEPADQSPDDGDAFPDGCVSTCGDNVQECGEQCDLGASNDDNAPGDCPSVCRTDCRCPSCGDGVCDFVRGEECDDGNLTSGDGCDSNCLVEPTATCGNGMLDIDQREECDDGNTSDGDGCSSTCQFEPVGQSCGDSTRDPLEKCDDGNTANGDGCNPTCNLTTTVSTLATGLQGDALAFDGTSLWIGTCFPSASPTVCEIQRIDIDACMRSGSCAPTTVAGGACGAPQDGRGTSAVLSCINSMTTDGIMLWFGNQHTLRAMDMRTFDVLTVAGSPNSCAAIDGIVPNAYFHDARGLTFHNGYVYLLDSCENVLRRFDPTTETVVTVAGQRVPDPSVTQAPPYTCPTTWSCVSNSPSDGYGLNAVFGSPRYMTADNSGNLYITDTNGQSIRSFNVVTGWVETLAGGPGYQDGVGAMVLMQRPRGITSDGTSLYWNEQTVHTVRQMIINTLDTSTMVGIRGCAGSRDGVGGDGTQDWNVPGCATAPAALPQIDTPMGGILYHFPSKSILLVEGGRLRWIQ
jgi:cysteine-rich repeat protein